MENISLNSLIKRDPSQIFSTVDGEVIMLSINEGNYFSLNTVGAEIWELIESPIKVEEIIKHLVNEYSVSDRICELETLDLLNDLLKNQLIVLC